MYLNRDSGKDNGEMEQQIKALATTPDNLCLIAGIHVIEGENWLP